MPVSELIILIYIVSSCSYRWCRQYRCCDFTCWSLKRYIVLKHYELYRRVVDKYDFYIFVLCKLPLPTPSTYLPIVISLHICNAYTACADNSLRWVKYYKYKRNLKSLSANLAPHSSVYKNLRHAKWLSACYWTLKR